MWRVSKVCSSRLYMALYSSGNVLFGGAPVLVAEATTMHDRIRAALQTTYNYLVVEANNSITIQAVQDHIHSPLQIQTLLQDVISSNLHCIF